MKMIRTEFPKIWLYKSSDKFTSGIPDIIGCSHGWLFAIELKTKTGKATPLQLHVLEQIRKAGGVCGICRSVEEVRAFISEIVVDKA